MTLKQFLEIRNIDEKEFYESPINNIYFDKEMNLVMEILASYFMQQSDNEYINIIFKNPSKIYFDFEKMIMGCKQDSVKYPHAEIERFIINDNNGKYNIEVSTNYSEKMFIIECEEILVEETANKI